MTAGAAALTTAALAAAGAEARRDAVAAASAAVAVTAATFLCLGTAFAALRMLSCVHVVLLGRSVSL
jgi:hypothetical protein